MRPMTAALLVAMFLFISHLQGGLQAYLDPNTGSMAIQFLLAGLVGVLATFKLYWHRMKAFFVRRNAERHGTAEGN
jgi:hypothetical protein